MPARVVTADLNALTGLSVVSVAAVPYREGEPAPEPLRNGWYLDVLAWAPAGVVEVENAPGHVFERPPQAIGRLRREDGGHRHEFYGISRRTEPLDPDNEEDALILESPRLVTLTIDLGARLNSRVQQLRWLGEAGAAELEIDGPGENATSQADAVYDALEDHPAELATIVRDRGQARRERASDAPPAWGQQRETVE